MIKVKEVISKQWLYAHMETIFVVFTMLLIVLATFKYVSHGESYGYEVPYYNNDTVQINGNIISQDIVIDKNAVWNKHSYAVYLYIEGGIEQGVIDVTLSQRGGVIDSVEILPRYIRTGWYELKEFDYSKLEAGYATIQFSGSGLDNTVYLSISNNIFNIPNCVVNGEETDFTLVQRYHYNFNNLEYKIRCAVFILFILISVIGTYAVCMKNDSVRISNLIYAVLTISYMCLTFIYDSSLWMSPIWSEAVTNFLQYGQNESIWFNIMQTDAGYLPLFQRLLALIIIRGLRLPAYYALFVMQAAAYFISGLILSFFSKYQFKEYFSLKFRYLLSLLFIILFISKATGAFISFIVYGFLIIMFYFLVDSKAWTRGEFITICVFSCLACMSKGTYVTVLPFMIVCAILFFKNYSKRDIIFSIVCAFGALLQTIYYFVNKSVNWIDRSGSAQQNHYIIKLILKSMIDMPRNILMLFYDKISFFNGISIIIFLITWVFLITFFIKKVVLKYIGKEIIDRNIQLFFVVIIYIFAQSLFLRITVSGVVEEDVLSDGFWTFEQLGELGQRYQISISIAIFALFIIITKILQEKDLKNVQMISVAVIILCSMIGQPRLQLKGIGNDNYVAARTTFADLPGEYKLFRNLEKIWCQVNPIQAGSMNWAYGKNASLYCFGDDIYFWCVYFSTNEPPIHASCTGFELLETWTGSVVLGNYPINTDVEIWQVFITKLNLIERSNYKIVLLDNAGNIIHQQYQDNTNYQKLTSFTFDTGISDVNQIVILDGNDNRVYIENSMYIVTEEGQQYFME